MNAWSLHVAKALLSISAGSAGYGGSQQAMGGGQSGSVHVIAFVSTDSMVAQQAFSVAIGAATAAAAWLLFGLLVYLVRKALKKPRGETSAPGQG